MKKVFRTIITLLVVVSFLLPTDYMVFATSGGTTYYVDNVNGNDNNSGTSQGSAWRTLNKVNGITFSAGDSILFKSGGSWQGTLAPSGSGSSSARITIDKYGGDAKPQIEGNGALAAVKLNGQEYWTIKNLNIANNASSISKRHGILVIAKQTGVTNGITIQNNEIHDVDGDHVRSRDMYNNAAIYFTHPSRTTDANKFSDILIDNNYIHDVNTSGIKVTQETDWDYADSFHRQVVVSNNTINKIGTDGMIISHCDSPLIKNNICLDAGYYGNSGDTRYIAGLWTVAANNPVFENNEVGRTRRFWGDGNAFDTDWAPKGTHIYQYNYSHDNEGGLFLDCSNTVAQSSYVKSVLRYNVSVNDKNFYLEGARRNVVEYYNNVFYNSQSIRIGDSSPNGSTKFWNNIFYLANTPDWGTAEYSNNCYYPENRNLNDANGIAANPLFVNVGATGDGMSIADNYKLQSTSPCINAGKVIAGNGGKDFFGNTVSGNYPDIGAHDTQTADPTPVAQNSNTFTANFDTADTSAWTTYGGTWGVSNGKYVLSSTGTGYKSIASNTNFSNFRYEADVTTGSSSNIDAGVVFRVSSPTVGSDSYNGYYAGVLNGGVVLGKAGGSWTQLSHTSMTVAANTTYHIKVIANGNSIKVYVDDMNTPKINATDSSYASGSIGVRTYNSTASFDNINVSPSFAQDFTNTDTSAWTTYGGTWSVDAGKYKLAGIGNGYKSVLSNYSFDNFTYEADITTGSESSVDSGIIFRVSNASVGADSFNGYYAGVRSDGVILGKSNGSWTQLSTASMTVAANTTYHIKVVANGSSIKVYVDDMNTAKISTTDSTYSSGSIGVRTYRTTASFDNINVALN